MWQYINYVAIYEICCTNMVHVDLRCMARIENKKNILNIPYVSNVLKKLTLPYYNISIS